MDITLSPAILKGSLEMPASKSEAHRALICSALTGAGGKVKCANPADDIMVTAECLSRLGADTIYDDGYFTVKPWHRPDNFPKLNCKESGSSLRFLIPVAALLGTGAEFVGEGRLPERPLSELLSVIKGCNITSQKLPFTLTGQLKAGDFYLPGNISSQYISGLLLSLPYLQEESRIIITSELESSGYVDMTIQVLERFGISVTSAPNEWVIAGGEEYRSPSLYQVEGDWSAAAFWLAAGALGADIVLHGLNPLSLQPDKAIINILKDFGAEIEVAEGYIKASRGNLKALDIDASNIPDLVPILALIASLAEGESRIYNAGRLRMKESNRLSTTAELLNALGGKVSEKDDALLITGVNALKGGIRVSGANDHRIVMTAAIASLFCQEPVTISGIQAVRKSYPDFFQDLAASGGKINVL
ncbi:MAG: 3-phosphoshikimate 1-carboxyvinyltransferase [Alphaproteobacteria bacterium]|nr:3-phosphoshikimate 1-carboxyvinyltransferase [Alphaproteobacteria bacterium]